MFLITDVASSFIISSAIVALLFGVARAIIYGFLTDALSVDIKIVIAVDIILLLCVLFYKVVIVVDSIANSVDDSLSNNNNICVPIGYWRDLKRFCP